MSDLIVDLYRHSEWANLRLLEECRALTDEQLDTCAVGTHGSIRETFVHLVAGEQRYIRRLGGQPVAPNVRETEPFPGFDVIGAAVRDNARCLIERVPATQGTIITSVFQGATYSIDAEIVLVQAIGHAGEHREQICAILTSLGIAPPDISGWEWGEAEGRSLRSEPLA
ncbi:MAG: DinB family protein [Dehalococcoidia bacterium]